MKRPKGRSSRRWAAVLLAAVLSLAISPAALADTGDNTPKITKQPEQLVLQLGTRWAGVEFELRTDAGVFPAPIAVDESGVLRMDLGGSSTYTLSCIESSLPIPDPQQGAEQGDAQTPPTTDEATSQQPPEPAPQPEPLPPTPEPEPAQRSVPIWPLTIFLMGLAAGGGCLAALYITKRNQQGTNEEWEDDEEE